LKEVVTMADIKEKYESMELPLLMLYKKQNELLKEYINLLKTVPMSFNEVYVNAGKTVEINSQINSLQNKIDQYR
jgi:hypothetical protein